MEAGEAMRPPAGTVPVYFVQSILKNAVAAGADSDQLLRRAGIDPIVLEIENARVPLPPFNALTASVVRLLNDELLGYAAVPARLGTWQMACLSSVHPGPVRHAIVRMCRFYRLMGIGLRGHIVVENDEALVELAPLAGYPEWNLFAYERALTALLYFVRWLLKAPAQLRTVDLVYGRPEHAIEYRWLFAGAEMVYNQPHCALRFDRTVFDSAVQRSERELDQLLMDPEGELTGATADGIWTSQVRKLVANKLPWLPEFEDVAAGLSIHPQTLRRRLAQEGYSFNDIKDQVRCNVAEYYLSKESLPVEEVAHRSGFSEASSFIRAFRRWTGTTPTTYAQRQRILLSTKKTHQAKTAREH